MEYLILKRKLQKLANYLKISQNESLIFPSNFITNINSKINENNFINRNYNNFLINKKISQIGPGAFYAASEIVFNKSFPFCKKICDDAFANAIISIKDKKIFTNCNIIGKRAFFNALGIRELEFPHCSIIQEKTFDGCYTLTSISFPVCTNIGNYAFHSCSALTSANFPVCSNIGSSAFSGCGSLTSISFPVCTNIGSDAFYACLALTSISFPVCTNIENYAFAYCKGLTSISFPVCNNIKSGAFYSCSALTSVNFPACTNIGSWAFAYCSHLMSVYLLSSTVCTLYSAYCFAGTPLFNSISGVYGSIYVPASLLNSYKTATNWASYSNRIVGLTDAQIQNILNS